MNQSTEDVYKQQKNNKKEELKIKKKLSITLIIIAITLLNSILVFNSVKAVNLNSTNIISGGDCGDLLIYKGIHVKTYYAYYSKDGKQYPAYCLDKTKHRRQIHKIYLSQFLGILGKIHNSKFALCQRLPVSFFKKYILSITDFNKKFFCSVLEVSLYSFNTFCKFGINMFF